MDEELMMVRVAELYYDVGRTHHEIGALLNISRWKVGRLLTRARDEGIVRIEIAHPSARRLALEHSLAQQHPVLKEAIVVPDAAEGEAPKILDRVAQAAADYLRSFRPVPRTLAVSWGRTLTAVADHLPYGWSRGTTVVQMNGGVSVNGQPGGAAHVAATMADRAAGEVVLLPSPAILEHEATARAIVSDRTVASVIGQAAAADAFLFTAGVCDETSAHVAQGYLSTADITVLRERGAVGDVLGRYIDAEGNIVDPSLDARTVGMSLSQLKDASTAIFVCAGESKHDLARTVVRSGLCSVIVTDEATARALLEEQ
ncbi:sugar-binding transcriptional regulator [Microbacterium sp. YY-01]|uniref:sugar-binding transcriptional regulator n=1 Tax=Microbacterium sp. YY-01 TaxID=3421634 RepID=UPI003D186D5A